MLRLLRFLFSLYAASMFALTFLITTPCYFLVFSFADKKRAPHIAHRFISRTWAKFIFIVFFIRIKIKNKELIDENQTYIFAANHQSLIDVPAYAVACNNTFRFLAKAELMKIPLLGYIIKNLYISVNRKDKNDRAKSMENMLRSLHDGVSVFIAVEGTRNKSNELLLPFKDGAFRIAIEAQLPIAVLTIVDAKKLLSPHRPLELSPGVLHCEWSNPIDTKGMTQDDLPKLKEMVRELMIKSLTPGPSPKESGGSTNFFTA